MTTTTPSTVATLPPTPYTVVVDTREGLPLTFASPIATGTPRRPHVISTVRACLKSGDYSLVGYETRVAIERKSLADLFSTLGAGRDRFQRELTRLSSYSFSAIVVEAEWSTVLTSPPAHSQLSPLTVFGTVVSWQQTYPSTHWWFVPGREVGEAVVARVLDKWWRVERAREMARGMDAGKGLLQQTALPDMLAND